MLKIWEAINILKVVKVRRGDEIASEGYIKRKMWNPKMQQHLRDRHGKNSWRQMIRTGKGEAGGSQVLEAKGLHNLRNQEDFWFEDSSINSRHYFPFLFYNSKNEKIKEHKPGDS